MQAIKDIIEEQGVGYIFDEDLGFIECEDLFDTEEDLEPIDIFEDNKNIYQNY